MSARSGMVIGTLAILGFIVTLTVMIIDRLSDQQVAVLIGAACGAGLALPLGLALGAYVATTRRMPPASPPSPPVIYMTPPPAPNTPLSSPRSIEQTDYAAPSRRAFNVIGDDGFDEE